MDKTQLADLRRDYSSKQLSRTSVAPDPFKQFSVWMSEALNSKVIDANAMTVSTVNEQGQPSARAVLLKAFDENGFVFFTNYDSRKAADLDANPHISLHFFWPDLERQVIVEGTAAKTTSEESEAYFATRPEDSKIGAWASAQSSVLKDREALEDCFAAAAERFAGQDIPCPPFWGGFRVVPTSIEFWQGRASRLHDRIRYKRIGDEWEIERLSP
jgi:pyridoxamine 5'-phosphate oxidase